LSQKIQDISALGWRILAQSPDLESLLNSTIVDGTTRHGFSTKYLSKTAEKLRIGKNSWIAAHMGLMKITNTKKVPKNPGF
jgi:hypothetical protein